jgi:hypothetical protein
MEGERAFVQDLDGLGRPALLLDEPRIPFRYSVGGGRLVSQGWEPLGPAGPYDTFGPELSFGARLEAELEDGLVIAKFTHSGTQIIDWTPAGSEARARTIYPRFVAFVREAILDLEERGHTVELAGIFYHLGENDMSFAPYRERAAERLAALVAQSRADLEMPELRWFVSQQAPTAHESVDRIDVTAAVAKLADADPNLIHVRAFDLPGREQELVITTAGIVALGDLLAARYLESR